MASDDAESGNGRRGGPDGDGRHRRHDEAHRHRTRDRDWRSRSPDASRRGGREVGKEREREQRREGGERERERDRRSVREREERRRRRKRRADSDADTGSDSGSGRERQRTRKRGDIPETTRRRGPLPDQADSFALVQQGGDGDAAAVRPPKEKANYGTTGALAAASNAVTAADGQTVTLKYHEPPEARKPAPADAWRLFVFKDGAIVDSIVLAARSCWLVGREAAVVDLLAAHPSVSKQHAVLQFRFVERRNEFGDRIGRVRPYVLDLASANGTRLNGEAVAAQRFVELRERDMVQFGDSTREYVLMKEG